VGKNTFVGEGGDEGELEMQVWRHPIF